MTAPAPVSAPVPAPVPAAARAPWPRRLRGFGRAVLHRAVLDPVRDGRPRDDGWPDGLRTVVIIALGSCALAALLAIGSPWLRSSLPLIFIDAQQAVLPRPTVWPLLVTMIVLIALFQTAALHAPWWLRTLALLTSSGSMLFWGFFGFVQAGGLGRLSPLVPILGTIGLVLLSALRARRSFAWWEFPVVLALVGVGLGAGPLLSGLVSSGESLGYDAVPLLVITTLQDAALLAVPVMIAAGLSVAELTVGLTVQAGAQAARFASRRWAHLILGVVLAVRIGQTVRQLVSWDPVADGWPVVITTVATAALLAVVALTVIRIGGRPTAGTAEELPEEANRLGLPVGAALTAILVVITAVIVVRSLTLLVLTGIAVDVAIPGLPSTATLSSATRVLLGLVLIGAGVLRARRRRTRQGLALGTTGVLLIAIAARFLTGGRYAAGVDPDVLNLVAAVVATALVVGALIRRRLTPRRSIQLSTALVLSTLFSVRDVLGDPLGSLIGVSGVALVVFGVFWDLFTGSGWANESGRRLAVPSRVQLIMAKSLLGLLVVAYAALTRSARNIADPDSYGQLGDLVLGTALIAAAFVAILTAVQEEPPAPVAEVETEADAHTDPGPAPTPAPVPQAVPPARRDDVVGGV